MKYRVPLLLLLLFLPPAAYGQENIHYEVDARLVVYDAGEAGDRVVTWLESEGGYFLTRRNDFIEGRLPAEKVSSVADALRGMCEDLLDYTLTASDVTEELLQTRASLASREEVLSRNLSFLDSADFSSTLAIEKEVQELIQEVEGLRGRIAVLQNHARYAALRLRLKSQGVRPGEGGLSNFDWINSLNFYSMMQDSPRKRLFSWLPRLGVPDRGPENFSVYRNSVLFRAISPEGVRIRQRTVEPEPRMDLDFWRTAVLRHLQESGYEQRWGVHELGQGGKKGFAVHWLVPYGGDEYVYAAAVIDEGKSLKIIESTGRLEAYDLRRSAIDSWLDEQL